MIKEFWINLPVKDLNKSKTFFAALGFSFIPRFANSNEMVGFTIGNKNIVVMLVPEPGFKSFTKHAIADTTQGSEVLLSIDTESREEVDEIAQKVVKAGGTIYGAPGEKDGWMYGLGFADVDGHRWNVLFMDMSKMPKG